MIDARLNYLLFLIIIKSNIKEGIKYVFQ